MRGIVITGASGGLGAALAALYAAPGVTLGLVGRDKARLTAVAERCRSAGAAAHTLSTDVAEASELGAWLTDFDRKTQVDLLVANAGTSAGPPLGARFEGVASASRQVRTNLLGVINTVEPLLPAFTARGRGCIGVVASVAALRGLPFSPAYSASKAGVRAYGEGLRCLVAPTGVRVCVVTPGFFSSPMTDRFKGATPFLLPLDRAAARVKRGLDRGRRRVTFPWLFAAGLYATDIMPPALGDAILRRVVFHIVPEQSSG